MDEQKYKDFHSAYKLKVVGDIKHWTSVKESYESLANRLKTLPDKPHHDVMVPFGPMAFKKGQIVHTNELFVLLGDSYFAEVTCKQGLRIIDHRISKVQENIDSYQKILDNLQGKDKYLQTELNNKKEQDLVEIKEEESSLPLTTPHGGERKRVSRVKGNKREVVKVVKKQDPHQAKTDEEIWKLLDALEMEEEKEEEHQQEKMETKKAPQEGKKRVSFKQQQLDSDDDPDPRPPVPTITFRHTPTPQSSSLPNHDDDDDVSNMSPAHISRHRVTSSPRGDGDVSRAPKPDRKQQQVMVDTIEETSNSAICGTGDSSNKQKIQNEKPARISKFKQSRMRSQS